jgi:alpha-ketoglutarate-dependent taurine dioxygenase
MNIKPLFSTLEHHPILITPEKDSQPKKLLHDYLKANFVEIQQLLLKHGGILFRDFDPISVGDFRACCEASGATPFHYIGGDSPRSLVDTNVYTSTDYPASEIISLHNEMSYLHNWPRRLFFFSAVSAAAGGQTSLASSVDILQSLPDSVIHKLRTKNIMYIRNFQTAFPLGKSWQDTFQTQSAIEVEKIISAQGSTWRWQADKSLRVSTLCKALVTHPQTGKEAWFNQAEQWHSSAFEPSTREALEEMVGKGNLPHECTYGDGEPMEDEVMELIRSAQNNNKLLFDWKNNDLLMIDNVSMMHGREAFKGNRKVLTYLSGT